VVTEAAPRPDSAALAVRLLGPPQILRDGAPAPAPRGHKTWAVLAYLALSERPVARARLAELIFSGADDPLGALRWALAQLRRALGAPDALAGDPLTLGLPAGTLVDVRAITGEDADASLARGELLEGVEPGAGPVFDAWLLVERRRLAGASEALLHEAAHAALAAGRPLDGAALASRALATDAFDEDAHELLVRCLTAAGDTKTALDHVAACEALFRRELGRGPDARVRRAAGPPEAGTPHAAGDRAAALGQLEAGRAALDAGAVEPGLACLRHACAEARAVGEPALLATALATLGVALVHAVRGRDEEGAAVLHEALALADEHGERDVAAKVCRELGYVEVQAGRSVSAGRWLLRASQLVRLDEERAAVLAVRGMALADRAHYEPAIRMLEASIAIARGCGDERRAAWSLAILGRVRVVRGELTEAEEVLEGSLALVRQTGWIAFQPFPEALRAEVALRRGDPQHASELLDHAFPLGCRLGDPCWEAVAARAWGLLHEAAGEREAALARLRDAALRAVRAADRYLWIHAYCLDALAGVEIADGAPEAAATVARLEQLAARADMRELVVRAALHRARLGDAAAVASARLLAETIDNPALHAELAVAA
jgi:DNA-binding SARP family transcriptional activator